jgi:hypothetical protein
MWIVLQSKPLPVELVMEIPRSRASIDRTHRNIEGGSRRADCSCHCSWKRRFISQSSWESRRQPHGFSREVLLPETWLAWHISCIPSELTRSDSSGTLTGE